MCVRAHSTIHFVGGKKYDYRNEFNLSNSNSKPTLKYQTAVASAEFSFVRRFFQSRVQPFHSFFFPFSILLCLACLAIYFSELFRFAETPVMLSFSCRACERWISLYCSIWQSHSQPRRLYFRKLEKAFMYTHLATCTPRLCNHFHLLNANGYILYICSRYYIGWGFRGILGSAHRTSIPCVSCFVHVPPRRAWIEQFEWRRTMAASAVEAPLNCT